MHIYQLTDKIDLFYSFAATKNAKGNKTNKTKSEYEGRLMNAMYQFSIRFHCILTLNLINHKNYIINDFMEDIAIADCFSITSFTRELLNGDSMESILNFFFQCNFPSSMNKFRRLKEKS